MTVKEAKVLNAGWGRGKEKREEEKEAQ